MLNTVLFIVIVLVMSGVGTLVTGKPYDHWLLLGAIVGIALLLGENQQRPPKT